jgi:hypothetical protein
MRAGSFNEEEGVDSRYGVYQESNLIKGVEGY